MVSTILPQSCSDLDTDQGKIINETLKHAAETVNQTLLKTTTGSHVSNLDSRDTPHDDTSGNQPPLQTQVMFINTQLHHKKHLQI